MEKDPNAISGAINTLEGIIKALKSDGMADTYIYDKTELVYEAIQKLMALKLTPLILLKESGQIRSGTGV